ncbi:MAG TPA: ABC transporter permease, partial [Lacipirellulaceae bacterium]|nr:ABC transporter permease [Lacipirellulaceae bacterium]
MNAWRFILASLRQYRRVHIAVALGVAVATAVLTGALLVGDSVRGSLRELTVERLGTIDTALVAGHPFRASLAGELAAIPDFDKYFAAAEPALLLNGTLQAGSGKAARRATGISVVGFAPNFWSLGRGGPEKVIGEGEVAITEPVARDLGVKNGGDLLLRIPVAKAIPGDSTLGEKSDTSRSQTLKVGAVLPVDGLARFGIAPSQQLPRNAFVPLATLQKLLQQEGKANAILVASGDVNHSAGDAGEQVLERGLHPALGDYGIRVKKLSSPVEEFQISADQLALPTEVVRAGEKVFAADSLQPISTYLANTISVGEGAAKRKIPYSTITGVDSKPLLGPLLDDKGQPIVLADDEIVLNRWAADDLHAKVGDVVTVTFYEPESTHGKLREHVPAPTFKLRAIAELKTADGKPSPAADPQLTPELPGVTDQKSISDWDLPFKLVETVRKQDEDYWHEYRTTPKAFVSLATAKRLWASRWGAISLLRLPVGKSSVDETAELLRREISPASLGMVFLPVKAQGLAASAGTTPFESLFIGFSFFLIAAAIMLVALLFQLGIEQRAVELGTLGAIGIGRRLVTRLLAREGMIVAAIGATCGVMLGVCYASLMIFGLRTWWLAAISTPFLKLHVSVLSLVIGWCVGIVVSWVTIWWSIRRLVRRPVRQLMSGAAGVVSSAASKSGRRFWRIASWPVLRAVFVGLVVVQCAAGFYLTGESQAGVFFGSGAAMLVLLLGEARYRLRYLRPGSSGRSFSLLRLSALNTARNVGRSVLTIGLVAAASFLILAVSAFHLNTGEGGTGGFDLIATSDMPIHFDLNTPEGRQELGVSDSKRGGDELSEEELLKPCKFYAFRAAAGENASCLNLYQPKQPRVLGVSKSFIDRAGFAWSATEKQFASAPWSALDAQLGKDESGQEIVPVVLDTSTAIYSLHLDGVGSRLTIRDSADRNLTLQVVGLLENS